jgi:hypothetical protein
LKLVEQHPGQSSRVFGLFAQRSDVLLALMGSTEQVPIGFANLGVPVIRRGVLFYG